MLLCAPGILWKAYFSNALYGALCKVGYGILAVSAFAAMPAYANPQGGIVSGGSATITQGGNTLDINQASNKAIIDWNSFNIGSGEKTTFVQPSASSVALNRVHDNNPSQILGRLIANGQVILVNPNGVFFGKGSQVDVSGLVATTANISNSDFMAGKLDFSQPGNPNASIVNQGTITAKEAGLVGFVAPQVENDGVITAKLGTVSLVSGDTFTLDLAGDNLITVAVSDAVNKQLTANSGTIQADGGTVSLTAAAARGVVNSLVSNTGVLQANSIEHTNGRIILSAAGSNAVDGNVAANKGQSAGTSTVLNSGTLSASGKDAGETGGSITVTADNVGILSGSVIDASGDAGGGSIKIGGDFHGGGTTPTALHTMVQSGTLIDASAITTGDGGSVAIWADDWTNFSGSILVRAGSISGNGGYVETSGKQILTMNGSVDASAAHGNAGTWLMDPANVTISTGTDASETGNPNFTPDGTGEAVINVSDITTALNAGTSVTITTGGDSFVGTNNGQITVANAITLNAASNNSATLTLSAYSNIIVNASITAPTTGSGKLNIILDADNGANSSGVGGNGSGYISSSANISAHGGNITMGGGLLSGGLPSGYALGNSTSGTEYGIHLGGGGLNASGGNIVLNGQGGTYASGTNYGVYIQGGGTIQTSGGGTISLTGKGGTADTTGSDYGVYFLNSYLTTTGTGLISLTGSGGGASGSGGSNYGVDVSTAVIQGGITPTGAAPITITGTAGDSTSYGIEFNTATGGITSAGGTVTLASPTGIEIPDSTSTANVITYAIGDSFDLVIDADTGGTGGMVYFHGLGGTITTNGGNIYIGGGSLDGSGHPTSAAVGTATNAVNYGIDLRNTTLNAGGGNITMKGTGG